MFDIFCKRKEIVLDCFTTNASVYSFTPIQKASNFIPSWWKNIPKKTTFDNEYVKNIPLRTMKGCTGLTDSYRLGLVLPLWSDLIINVRLDEIYYQWASSVFETEFHPPEQHDFQLNFYHTKLVCPWRLRCKENINFYFSSPFWNLTEFYNDPSKNFHILPGIMNFNLPLNPNVNMFFVKKQFDLFLKCNTPIYYISPLTEKNIIIKNHLVSDYEYKKLDTTHSITFEKTRIIKNKLLSKL